MATQSFVVFVNYEGGLVPVGSYPAADEFEAVSEHVRRVVSLLPVGMRDKVDQLVDRREFHVRLYRDFTIGRR